MKRLSLFLFPFLTTCHSPNDRKTGSMAITPGSIIATDTMPGLGNPLNHPLFSLIIIKDSQPGYYTIRAANGYDTARNLIRFPKGGEDLNPVIRKNGEPFTYLVGFYMEGDTLFHDFYLVKADTGYFKMKYVKSYTFE